MNQLRIGPTIKTEGVKIIPIEQISIARENRTHMLWWQGNKQVYALVIMSSAGIYAIDTNARELVISELISSLPQLAEILISETDGK